MATDTKAKSVKAAVEVDAAVKPKRVVKSGLDRRPRGWLETEVLRLSEKFADGSLVMKEKESKDGKKSKNLLTPHHLARFIQTEDVLDEPPSTGAVAAVFTRWKLLGFATFNEKPFSFKAFTAAGQKKGLEIMKEEKREALFAAKKAEREANPKPKAAPKPKVAKVAKPKAVKAKVDAAVKA